MCRKLLAFMPTSKSMVDVDESNQRCMLTPCNAWLTWSDWCESWNPRFRLWVLCTISICLTGRLSWLTLYISAPWCMMGRPTISDEGWWESDVGLYSLYTRPPIREIEKEKMKDVWVYKRGTRTACKLCNEKRDGEALRGIIGRDGDEVKWVCMRVYTKGLRLCKMQKKRIGG